MHDISPTSETRQMPTILELLIELQDSMRLYDSLVPQLEELKLLQESRNALLVEFDLEAAAQQGLAEVAFAALNKVIADAKVAELERQIAGCERSVTIDSLVYRGRRVSVTAQVPDVEQIEDFALDGSGYRGKRREHHQGKLVSLGLRASDGGFITFKSKYTLHQAGPLFDRDNDFRPLFEIAEV